MSKPIFSIAVMLFLLLPACNSKETVLTISREEYLNDTIAECKIAKEVCDEAKDFYSEYTKMPDKEKKDMNAVLNSYVEQCNQMQSECLEKKKLK